MMLLWTPPVARHSATISVVAAVMGAKAMPRCGSTYRVC
jgi:hypothetical protein